MALQYLGTEKRLSSVVIFDPGWTEWALSVRAGQLLDR